MFVSAGFTWILFLLSSPVRCDPELIVPNCTQQVQAQNPWLFNSKKQSSCLVAGYLGSVCSTNNAFDIPPIASGEFYELLTSQINNCTCSSVYYSTLSACSFCQGQTFVRWNDWISNCTLPQRIFDSFFPQPIPTGTAVPHWAYQNYLNSSSSTFNVTLAQQLSDNPESSAPSGPTSTSNSANAKGRSEGGAIAGGVVGGIAFLVISAILVFLFLRHRRRKAAASRDRPSIDDVTAFTAPTSHPTDPPSPPPMRLYNPSDPSTFPPSQDMIQNNNTESPFSPLSRHPLRNIHAPTQYTGVPEL